MTPSCSTVLLHDVDMMQAVCIRISRTTLLSCQFTKKNVNLTAKLLEKHTA